MSGERYASIEELLSDPLLMEGIKRGIHMTVGSRRYGVTPEEILDNIVYRVLKDSSSPFPEKAKIDRWSTMAARHYIMQVNRNENRRIRREQQASRPNRAREPIPQELDPTLRAKLERAFDDSAPHIPPQTMKRYRRMLSLFLRGENHHTVLASLRAEGLTPKHAGMYLQKFRQYIESVFHPPHFSRSVDLSDLLLVDRLKKEFTTIGLGRERFGWMLNMLLEGKTDSEINDRLLAEGINKYKAKTLLDKLYRRVSKVVHAPSGSLQHSRKRRSR